MFRSEQPSCGHSCGPIAESAKWAVYLYNLQLLGPGGLMADGRSPLPFLVLMLRRTLGHIAPSFITSHPPLD